MRSLRSVPTARLLSQLCHIKQQSPARSNDFKGHSGTMPGFKYVISGSRTSIAGLGVLYASCAREASQYRPCMVGFVRERQKAPGYAMQSPDALCCRQLHVRPAGRHQCSLAVEGPVKLAPIMTVSVTFWPFVCLSYLSIDLSIYLQFYLSIYLSIPLSIYVCTYLPTSLRFISHRLFFTSTTLGTNVSS